MEEYEKTLNGNNSFTAGNGGLEQAYMELGKAYYEGRFEDPLPELLPLFDRITTLKNRGNQNGYHCRKCGKEILPDDVFCGNCGAKLK